MALREEPCSGSMMMPTGLLHQVRLFFPSGNEAFLCACCHRLVDLSACGRQSTSSSSSSFSSSSSGGGCDKAKKKARGGWSTVRCSHCGFVDALHQGLRNLLQVQPACIFPADAARSRLMQSVAAFGTNAAILQHQHQHQHQHSQRIPGRFDPTAAGPAVGFTSSRDAHIGQTGWHPEAFGATDAAMLRALFEFGGSSSSSSSSSDIGTSPATLDGSPTPEFWELVDGLVCERDGLSALAAAVRAALACSSELALLVPPARAGGGSAHAAAAADPGAGVGSTARAPSSSSSSSSSSFVTASGGGEGSVVNNDAATSTTAALADVDAVMGSFLRRRVADAVATYDARRKPLLPVVHLTAELLTALYDRGLVQWQQCVAAVGGHSAGQAVAAAAAAAAAAAVEQEEQKGPPVSMLNADEVARTAARCALLRKLHATAASVLLLAV